MRWPLILSSTALNKDRYTLGRIVVTGIGAISAIGINVAENRDALIHGRTGIGPVQQIESKFSGMPCGEISLTNQQLMQKLEVDDPALSRTTLLGLHAFDEAIALAKLTNDELQEADTALIVASTVGGMCLTDELYHNAHGDGSSIQYLPSYEYSSVALFIQEKYRIGGIVNTINTACSSSANAIIYGARLLKSKLARRVIVGGTDSLAKFTINGFNALRILSDELCRPFDAKRKGLNLGEGAAFLVLQNEEDVKTSAGFAVLAGYSNANDAFHPSSLSDEGNGPFLAMQGALQSAGLPPNAIDFINTHGTGTENNDEAESRAMVRLFGTPPAFASTKTFTGHTLGAANAVETVYSILSLQHQEVYPNLNFSTPGTNEGLIPVRAYAKANLRHVMSNSFGFGGNCTSLVLSTV